MLVSADWLFLLTDVDCLYTANPKSDPDAKPIPEVGSLRRALPGHGPHAGATHIALTLLTPLPDLLNPLLTSQVHDITTLEADTSTNGTQWGTGGMATKLTAARMATAAGCRMVICNSNQPEAMSRVLLGESHGTLFHPAEKQLKGRKRWILSVPARWEQAWCAGMVCWLALIWHVGWVRTMKWQ